MKSNIELNQERLTISNMKCTGCAEKVKNELMKIEGVKSAEVDLAGQTVDISYEHLDREVITNRLRSIGYPVGMVKGNR